LGLCAQCFHRNLELSGNQQVFLLIKRERKEYCS
jgi:hypothetical protein